MSKPKQFSSKKQYCNSCKKNVDFTCSNPEQCKNNYKESSDLETIKPMTNRKFSIKSKVFKIAHKLRSKFNSWSDALKFAWAKIKLTQKLKNKVCYFQFKKKSTGELRYALGTTNKEYYDYEFKGGSWSKWNIVKFWDTNISEWRCLDVRTLTKIYW